MDRHEWGEIVGDKGTVVDDLRWTLFQAERSNTTMDREISVDKPKDWEVFDMNVTRIRQAQKALATLWTK